MTTEVDHAGVFQTVLPNVYIKKVSLLPGSMVDMKRAQHYDESKTYDLVTNEFGKKVPRKQSPSYESLLEDSQGLTVNIELCIKDEYLSSGRSRWFDNKELIEQLKIRVLMCRNPELTEDLLERRFTPRYLNRYREQGRFIEQIINVDDFMGFSLREQRKEEIDRGNAYSVSIMATFNVPNTNPRHLTIFAHSFTNQNEYILEKKKRITQSRKGYLQGNTSAQKIIEDSKTKEAAHVFLLPNKKVWAGPVHYHKATDSYMVGISHTTEPHSKLERTKITNFIIEDYRLLENLAQKRVQLRPAPRTRNRPRRQNRGAHNLKTISSEAYVSEPIYSIDRINRVKLLFNFNFEKIIAENTQYGRILKTADKKAKSEIYSQCRIKDINIYRHRVEQGLRKNQVKLTEYEEQDHLVARSSEISAGRVPRKRTTRTIVHYDKQSEEVLTGAVREISVAANRGTGIRTIGVTDYDMPKRTDGLYRYSVEMVIEDGTVAFVKAQSVKLAEARKALKSYYAEASRKGASDKKTGQFKSEFSKRQKELYPMADRQTILAQTRSNRNTEVQSSIAYAPWLNAIATYLDVLYNITDITPKAVLRASRLLHEMCDPTIGSLYGLEVLINLILKLEYHMRLKMDSGSGTTTGAGGDASVRRMDEIDYNARTRSYRGKISNNSFTIAKRFKTTHNSNLQKNIGYDFLSGGIKKSIGPRFVSVQEFKTRMDAENQKFFNSSYNDMTAVPDTGPDDTNGQTNYFTKDIDLQNKYFSYLTPAHIRIGNIKLKTINRGGGLWNPKQYNRMLSVIMAANPHASSPIKSIINKANAKTPDFVAIPPIAFDKDFNSETMDVDKDTFLANVSNSLTLHGLGVTIATPQEFQVKELKADVKSGRDREELSLLEPNSFLGDDSRFITLKIDEDDEVLENNINQLLEGQEDLTEISNVLIMPITKSTRGVFSAPSRIKKIQLLNAINEENAIDRFFGTFTDGETRKKRFISALPNHIKSILLGDSGSTSKNWFNTKRIKGKDLVNSPELAGVFYFFYQHINKVEVLIGYEKDARGNPVVSAPLYKEMTKDMFDKIKKDNLMALCRMSPYSNKLLGFHKSPKLKLPEYDTHFLLGSKPVTRQDDELEEANLEDAPIGEDADVMSGMSAIEQEIYTGRLVEYSSLNTTGTRVLRTLIKNILDQDEVPPEFSSSAFIQQPYTTTRVGTRFTSNVNPRSQQTGESIMPTVMVPRRRSQSGMVSMTTPTSTPSTGGTAATGAPATSTGGTSGGGMGGGGY
jgi:hypothetical protein